MPRKYIKKKTTKKSTVPEAVKKYVKSTVSREVENKYIIQDTAAVAPLPSTGTVALLSHSPAISQGAGSNQRVGDAVKLKRLDLILHLSASATYNAYVRILLVQYKQQDGRDLAISDVMLSTAGYGPNRPLYPAHVLHEKVRILYDKFHLVEATGNVTADENHKVVRIRKRLNIKQTYLRNAAAGTYADIATNGLYLLIFGSNDAAGNARCNLRDGQWIVEYEDA